MYIKEDLAIKIDLVIIIETMVNQMHMKYKVDVAHQEVMLHKHRDDRTFMQLKCAFVQINSAIISNGGTSQSSELQLPRLSKNDPEIMG